MTCKNKTRKWRKKVETANKKKNKKNVYIRNLSFFLYYLQQYSRLAPRPLFVTHTPSPANTADVGAARQSTGCRRRRWQRHAPFARYTNIIIFPTPPTRRDTRPIYYCDVCTCVGVTRCAQLLRAQTVSAILSFAFRYGARATSTTTTLAEPATLSADRSHTCFGAFPCRPSSRQKMHRLLPSSTRKPQRRVHMTDHSRTRPNQARIQGGA